ncbi:hypothetical protein Acid345_2463 [Candidatus Koribacter versatilis Ellin345]|uniref:ARG and Rhodanese-Phosphatase-superfamily-associated domain-containing protein n=1 Tax=Koribacter versatilis (strain Ellin345) TaxID=204669 RepID=Q1INT6_KORVE|nr:DUF6569 family protein [Candidatus Koribacter versatilis]ABF41464.1 hypothetical protein Acid345_2463 [Candidatus Koribacter versatilis Ellin345]
MKRDIWIGALVLVLAAALFAAIAFAPAQPAQAGPLPEPTPSPAPGPDPAPRGEYRVLEPLHSGALTLFPVVRNLSGAARKWDYITLDEGLRNGEVEVTEYGRLRGLVRPRNGAPIREDNYRGDRVNTLVLVNHSDKPLILLAGEIVTGGKQDRVIGKDRIVPAQSDPIDLSVFCIEHGRWVESSDKFGVSADSTNGSFMVQPSVRSKAMVKNNQQEVWDSVAGAVSNSARAASPSPTQPVELGTTSYAKAMKDERLTKEVDKVAVPLTESSHDILQKLREQNAVGVIVAVRGQIIWADVFATPDMLSAYWTKLVRSYAAESFETGWYGRGEVTRDAAERFLNNPLHGSETSQGETGVYRYREVRGTLQSAFFLQTLLPGTDFDVHISRVVEDDRRAKIMPRPVPMEGRQIPID